MYQTVIFDLDGTLLDTIEDLKNAGNWICRKNGWPEHTTDEFKALVGHGMRNLVMQLMPEKRRSPLMVTYMLTLYMERYGAHDTDNTRPYEGIPELLKKMKAAGIRMAVCSNKSDQFSRDLMQHFFPDTFDVVRGKLEGVPVKPDPQGTLQVMELLGADPATTLFVGDSRVDIETGKNIGAATCGVSWGFRKRETLVEAGADTIADTVAELEAVIFA